MKIHETSQEAHLKAHASSPSGLSLQRTRAVQVDNVPIGGPEFVVIAGPCSIESREQFLETAQSVKNSGAVLLRGGIWKMRTNPKTFQGLGPEAVGFVREVLNVTGLSLVSEITDPRQVEILDPLVSMYQVGARNMFNYSLLKELGQTNKPVLLKRGFSALVEEWIKAAEYITLGGNDKIILCERGIRTFENSTRYTFDLNAVLVAKSKTNFPVVVDPSHAVGVREYVPKVALAAAAAGADGLIIEVHPRPAEALSDGFQSLTLEGFRELSQNIEKVLTALGRPLLKPEL
jgi:3-deoxy-7-phosphoheptulonate synthase